MLSFKTVMNETVAELQEKRSRFIATLRHVETEEEAMAFVNEMKAKYWDARHNVFAYILNDNNLVRYSDDGEPHGTAGKPVLDVISGRGLKNVAIVVTRYFGGILLGTGGLVRAYSGAAIGACDTAEIYEMVECSVAETECDYAQYEKLKVVLLDSGAIITDTVFENTIKIEFYIKKDLCLPLQEKIVDVFYGRMGVTEKKSEFFPIKL